MDYILDYYFVAFVDILGFSNMVSQDCESPAENKQYISKLLKVHQDTANLSSSTLPLQITQFSDSIVIVLPYDENKFPKFLEVIAGYQYNLFCEGILCRGGVAYGQHFQNGTFMFSNGLIEAYNLEVKLAKYPRIIVSSDLMDLLYPDRTLLSSLNLIKENDNVFFLDYLKHGDQSICLTALEGILNVTNKTNAQYSSKHRWLIEYLYFTFPSLEQYNVQRFSSA